jgi:hypothetical protein
MATEKLTLLTQVQGATAAAGEIGKIGGAIDRVSGKAAALRGKLTGAISRVGGFLNQTGLGYAALNAAGSIGSDIVAASNAGTGGVAGTAGNILGGAATGAAFAGPIGALGGIVTGIGKSAIEIGEATREHTAAIKATGEKHLQNATLEDLNKSIAGIDAAIQGFMDNPLSFFLGGGDAVRDLKALKDKYEEQKRVLMAEGSDTERAIRNNATSVVGAINGIDVAPTVNVSVNVSGSQTASVSYTSGTTNYNFAGGAWGQGAG